MIFDLLDVPAVPVVPPFEVSDLTGEVILGGVAGTIAVDLDETQTALAAQRARYRLYFTDSLGGESLMLRGRLGLVEEDE